MQFNLAEVPFSRCRSYMAIEQRPANGERAAGIYLRTLHGDAPRAEVCRIELWREGASVAATARATPGVLRLEAAAASLDLCLTDVNVLRLCSTGSGVRLQFALALYDSAIAWRDGWLINSFSNRMRYALLLERGVAVRSERSGAHWYFECEPDASGGCELALVEAPSQWPSRREIFAHGFSQCCDTVAQEFAQWLQMTPRVPAEFAAARELAAYVQWSSVVAPCGNFQRPAMLMSKHWLNAVWSWDHCFNAMALLPHNPALAWDQFLLLFDQQEENGALPDCISDTAKIWNFCKPPVHGWALQWMLRHGEIAHEQLLALYAPLSRWTQWWFDARTSGDDLPQYFHGNDSGWDNASVFDMGLPVQSPDLAAFLVLQLDALAEVARRLGRHQEAAAWTQRADVLLEKLLTRCWLDTRFVALHEHKPCEGDSLLLLLPIVLGARLPQSIRRALIAGLRQQNRFLTEFGLASESVASPLYESDGYWRGPIWAPAVFIIVESLREVGEADFADEIAHRFCRTVARSGMAENFDALTGAGRRDPAHTWTASVFLLLANSLSRAQ